MVLSATEKSLAAVWGLAATQKATKQAVQRLKVTTGFDVTAVMRCSREALSREGAAGQARVPGSGVSEGERRPPGQARRPGLATGATGHSHAVRFGLYGASRMECAGARVKVAAPPLSENDATLAR